MGNVETNHKKLSDTKTS